jgi:hypothetical protein
MVQVFGLGPFFIAVVRFFTKCNSPHSKCFTDFLFLYVLFSWQKRTKKPRRNKASAALPAAGPLLRPPHAPYKAIIRLKE